MEGCNDSSSTNKDAQKLGVDITKQVGSLLALAGDKGGGNITKDLRAASRRPRMSSRPQHRYLLVTGQTVLHVLAIQSPPQHLARFAACPDGRLRAYRGLTGTWDVHAEDMRLGGRICA